MTDNPRNCSTCPYRKERSVIDEGFECMKSRTYIPLSAQALIEYVGCLSHPDARTFLMMDVIEELERKKTLQWVAKTDTIQFGFGVAIQLIKRGVKK